MDLHEELGKALTPQEVGELFGIDPTNIRKCLRLGGVEVAPGCTAVLENRIRSLIYAEHKFGEAFFGGAELSQWTGR